VYAKRYSAAGVELPPPSGMPLGLGNEFRVNSYTTGFQNSPSVATSAAGNFVVAWVSIYQDGSSNGVFAQRYSSAGQPLGPEFRVNTYTTNDQWNASVAMDAAGDFVVAWRSGLQDGSGDGVYGQRYSATGVAQGGEFRVNTYTTSDQGFPSVAIDAAGDFAVA